ncbi:MAG: hypothetical protein IT462_02670 [Planctomycetes bacterium]|nr:hypothetical protein [Planctomycetota bacterium]
MALSVAFIAPPMIGTSPDPHVRVEVARAMLERGKVSLPAGMKYDLIVYPGRGGENYGIYGIGQSLVFLPLDAIARAASSVAHSDMRLTVRDSLLAGSYMVVVNVALALAVFLVLRQLRLSTRMACIGTLVIFVGSQWIVWAKWLHEETLAATLLLFAGYFILSARRGSLAAKAIAFGTCAGFLANVRLNAVFAGLVLLVWGLWQLPGKAARVKFLLLATAALIPWLALLAGYNYLRFESITETGYGIAVRELGKPLAFDLERFVAITVGPDCGMIWFALPLLALLAFAALRMRNAASGGAAAQLAGLTLHIVFLSFFVTPAPAGEDGYCGPRYLAHNLIVLGPFCWIATRRLWTMRRPLIRYAIAATWCFSAAMQLAGVVLYADLEVWQNEVRHRAGVERTAIDHYIVGRAKNIPRLLNGSLRQYTLAQDITDKPIALPVPEESLAFSIKPHFLPWRIAGSARADAARSGAAFWGLVGGWGVLGAAAALAAFRMARRRVKVQSKL